MSGNEHLKKGDYIQIFIAVILAGTCFVLIFNLVFFRGQIKLTQDQIKLTQDQIELTQALNQPLIAVKDVKVTQVRPSAIETSLIIKNFGNYVAKDVTIKWEFYQVSFSGKNPRTVKVETRIPQISGGKKQITILPQHEFKQFLVYVGKKDYEKVVAGYSSAILLKATLRYPDMYDKTQEYSCEYLITKLLGNDKGVATFEASLKRSSLKTLGDDHEK